MPSPLYILKISGIKFEVKIDACHTQTQENRDYNLAWSKKFEYILSVCLYHSIINSAKLFRLIYKVDTTWQMKIVFMVDVFAWHYPDNR